ncbi:MAG: PatB family C-S lyase [Bacteroidales bacterium]|nr:PatB family C-S lyase [Bacteroidales bacterium]
MKYDFDTPVARENTSSAKYDLRKEIFGRSDVIPLWLADMDFQTPGFIIEALKRRLQHEILGYSFPPDSFYDAIINWNRRRHEWVIKKEWIGFSPGVVPALNLLVMALTKPGDKIIVQPPVYFPFFSAVENHGRILVNNPLYYDQGEYRMDLKQLVLCLDDKVTMIFLCNPHNPTGNVWEKEVLMELANLCAERNIIMVSDEIHSDLIYPRYRHIPLASLSSAIAGHTITCLAPSKTFNLAGLSTSYLVISNPELKKKYDAMLDLVHVGAGNIFGFTALEAAYNEGDEWLEQLMEYIGDNLRFLTDFLREYIPPIKVVKPAATYMVWLDCREMGLGVKELRDFMIHKAGLGLSDGPLFGQGGEGFQRINIACPRATLEKALCRLQDAVKKKVSGIQ